MGVDAIIDYDCPVKQQLGLEELFRLGKTRNQANAILDLVRKDGDQRPPSEITFTNQLRTPEGIQEKKCNLQQMLDESAVLDNYAPTCSGCRANSLNKPFGCWSYLNFPVLSRQEEWLMSLLPEKLESTAGQFLEKAIKDFDYDGGSIPKLRRQGRVFFERNSPVKRKWGGFFSGKTISSDQIMQAMFFVGPIQPNHGLLLLLFLNFIPHDIDPEVFAQLVADPSKRAEFVRDPDPGSHSDPAIEAMAEFLRGVRISCINDVHLIIDA